jgi:acyl-CoA thioesterase-1
VNCCKEALVTRCFGIAVIALTSGASVATAAEIVALGASNTEGMGRGKHADGVSRELAYPAQLGRILNSSGCRVQVVNAGVAGDTTSGMLARLPGLLDTNTKVLVLQPGGNDERRGHGGDVRGNVAAIQRMAAQHGIKVIILDRLDRIAPDARLPDGQHFSATGHAKFAGYLAPKVRAAGACAK